MKRIGVLLSIMVVSLSGCDGLKDAFTAHVDVAAKAGSQELTAEKLGEMLGNSTVPIQAEDPQSKEVARAVADVWVNYQLIAQAAARHDSLKDNKALDEALWQQINQALLAKYFDSIQDRWMTADSTVTEAEYNQGTLLSAAHILFSFPPGASQAQMDSVKREADRVRRLVTSANFAQMAATHSKDPGSAGTGGLYAAFPRAPDPGAMVKEFEDAVIALKPGEISDPVQTMYGYHILRRSLFEEVRADHARKKAEAGMVQAQQKFMEEVDAGGNVEVKPKAAEIVRKVVADLPAHAKDNSVIATSVAGKFTAADFARIVRSFPERQQVVMEIGQMPDSVVPLMVKQLVRNDLYLRGADSANIALDSTEIAGIRMQLTSALTETWMQLGVDPASLGDSATSAAERSREAASRIDSYVDGLLTQSRQYVPIPEPLESLLRAKFNYTVSDAGLERAIQQAVKVRAKVDSLVAGQSQGMPPSSIQMDGGSPPPPSGTVPPPSTPPGGGGGGGERE